MPNAVEALEGSTLPVHDSQPLQQPAHENTESDRMLSNAITDHRRNRRFERHAECQIFVNLAVDWFPEIAKRDPRHQFLADRYGFHVVPGGRERADDRQLLEVFYGERAIEQVTETRPRPGQNGGLPSSRRTLVTERGASLRYQRTDHGTVLCLLEPARSQGFERPESLIVLAHIKDPRVLTGKPILERHWRSLISYFECSSIDGDPGFSDRIRVWWLLYTKPLTIDGKAQRRHIIPVGGQILKWAIAIGLAAALLAAAKII